MYRGNDASFEIIVYWMGAIVDLSNVASLTLSIWSAERKIRKASKTVMAANITANPVATDWVAGTGQHAAFVFSGLEMNWALDQGQVEENYFMVLAGITNDIPGHNITYGTSSLTLVEDAEGIAGTPPVNDPLYYTEDEADARFIPAWGDGYTFRVSADGFLQFYTQADGKWHSAIPVIVDGHMTFSPGPPVD
jgi:hypothetical protein